MNNDPWSDDELAAIDKPWKEFHDLHPERSYNGWRIKRGELRKGRLPTPKKKVKHVSDDEDQITDDELWDATVAYQDAVNSAFPHRIHHQVQLDVHEPVAIAFPSDWHIGSAGVDMR